MGRRWRTTVVAVLAGFLVEAAGCGAATPSHGQPAATSIAVGVGPAIAHVGTAGFIGTDADNIAVVATLTEVLDPATATPGDNLPQGQRLVAAVFKISDVGIAPTTDSARDVTVLGSDGQTYQVTAQQVVGCPPLGSRPFTVAAGAAITGCAVFELPTTVAPARVTFSPSDGGAIGVWQVP